VRTRKAIRCIDLSYMRLSTRLEQQRAVTEALSGMHGFRELGVNMMEVMITTKQRGKCCNFSFSFSATTNKILSNRGVFFNSTNRQLGTYFLF